MRLCTRLRDEAIHKEGRDGVACFVLRRQIWGWELVARRKQLAAAGWLGGGEMETELTASAKVREGTGVPRYLGLHMSLVDCVG